MADFSSSAKTLTRPAYALDLTTVKLGGRLGLCPQKPFGRLFYGQAPDFMGSSVSAEGGAIRPPWLKGASRLWSLLAMIEAWAAEAYLVCDLMKSLQHSLVESTEPITDEQRAGLLVALQRAYILSGHLQMTTTMDLVVTLEMDAKYGTVLSSAAVIHHLEAIHRALRAQINNRWFLYLTEEAADLYQSPIAGWGAVPIRFPSVHAEIIAGSECLAVSQPTAAVFHFMRVLERGLRALATDLGIPTAKQEISTWGDMLKDIKDATDAKVQSLPKGKARTTEAEYYGALLQDFRHFKDAWRDRVSHSDRRYDADEAKSVRAHVRDFMTSLAVRLHE
jgi:hypothetical protein